MVLVSGLTKKASGAIRNTALAAPMAVQAAPPDRHGTHRRRMISAAFPK
jgi:hypothetical protein